MKWTFFFMTIMTMLIPTLADILRIRHHRLKYNNDYKNNHERYMSQDKYFQKVMEHIETTNDLINTLCVQNGAMVSEVYEKFGYVIVYSIREFNDRSIEVNIKNGVLYTRILKHNKHNDFFDIRILPNILNFKKAYWYTTRGELKIVIPYNVKFGDKVPNICVFDKTNYCVPQKLVLIDIK